MFHLVDLVSQCSAVERAVAGLSDERKLAWLATYGRLTERTVRFGEREQTIYEFTSSTGRDARFFLDGGQFVFFGDHTTFRP